MFLLLQGHNCAFIMKTECFELKSVCDGLGISVLAAEPDVPVPEMVILLSHGMCGCKERFMPFMEFMTRKGAVCVANDHRGHGRSVLSDSDLGYMYEGGYEALVEDMALVAQWIHKSYEGIPVFLVGHSMGSMAARVFVRKHDELIDGVILCGSPSWNPLSLAGYPLMAVLERIGAGRFRPALLSGLVSKVYNRRFAAEGHNAWTCSDPETRKAFRENVRCNYTFTVNGTKNLLAMMIDTYRNESWNVRNSSMPVLFLSGADDPCMISEKRFHDAAKQMYRHGYHDVSSVIYDGMRHEILNEKEKEYVWNDIFLFVESRLHTSDRLI